MVNTLVLVYAGSALPLLLLFYGGNRSFMDIIEFELIAEEMVRMMVGYWTSTFCTTCYRSGSMVYIIQHNKHSTKVGYTPSVNNKL